MQADMDLLYNNNSVVTKDVFCAYIEVDRVQMCWLDKTAYEEPLSSLCAGRPYPTAV